MTLAQFLRNDRPISYLVLMLSLAVYLPSIATLLVAFVKPARAWIPALLATLGVAFTSLLALGRNIYLMNRLDGLVSEAALGPGTSQRILHQGSVEATTSPKIALFLLALPLLLTILGATVGMLRSEKRSPFGLAIACASALFLGGPAYGAYRAEKGHDWTDDEATLLDLRAQIDDPSRIARGCFLLADHIDRRVGRPLDVRTSSIGEDAMPNMLAKKCVTGMDSGAVPSKAAFARSKAFLALLSPEQSEHVKSFDPQGDPLVALLNGQGMQDMSGLGDKPGYLGLPLGLDRPRSQDPLAPKSSLRSGELNVSGRLPPEVIRRVIMRQMGSIRSCYERGLAKNPNLSGKIVVKFVIDRSGQVASVEDAGSTLQDAEVKACVFRRIKNLVFPAPEGGAATVTYPFVFTSTG